MPLSAEELTRVFYAADDVAFAQPGGALSGAQPEDEVLFEQIEDGMPRTVARGRVFRVREEHIAIRVTEGKVRAGDCVRLADKTGDGLVSAATMPAGTSRWYLYRLVGAPRVVADDFDEAFARELSSETGAWSGLGGAGGRVELIRQPAAEADGTRPSLRDMRRTATLNGADLVLLPYYVPGEPADIVAMAVYNGRTGKELRTIRQPIQPLSGMAHATTVGRAGAFEIKERYSGLAPAPGALLALTENAALVTIGDDRFVLESGRARFVEWKMVVPVERAVELRVDSAVFSVAIDSDARQGERVVIREQNRTLFGSAWFPSITAISVSGRTLMVLRGDTLDVLRWNPPAGWRR